MPFRRLLRPGARHWSGATVMVLLGLGLLVSQMLVAFWILSTTRSGAAEAVEDVLGYVADVSADRVGRYVGDASSTTEELAAWIESDSPGFEMIADRVLEEVRVNQQVRAVAVVHPDGGFVIATRPEEESDYAFRLTMGSPEDVAAGVATTREYNDGGRSRSTVQAPLGLDPRMLDFYAVALDNEALTWTEPALRPVTQRPGTWSTVAVRNDAGEPVAVVASDFLLGSLSVELNELPLGADGEAFVLYEDRTVIAAPPASMERVTQSLLAGGVRLSGNELGIETTAPATPASSADVFGAMDGLVVVERGLGEYGVDWVLHIRASGEGLSPGVAQLESTLVWATAAMVLAIGVAGAVLLRSWRPLGELSRAARKDSLTGLLNRRHFHAVAPGMIAALAREDLWVCTVALDLDNFKSLNDTRGHGAGDEALELVGNALRDHTRRPDLVVRWGGDEFIALLALESEGRADALAERLRSRVEAELLEEFGSEFQLGVTAGYAVSRAADAEVDDLVRRADRALVHGKRSEKSRVHAAGI
ncbi:diguanylate cyclase [Demequina sp. NBRC 110052]|uniref:GGDEF domain-containing protein n=1 Tax=Demequina sp. NBRC 110052 TaxID=1570341 RepID=UPI001180574A|nr:sensor domain-containing diguanylate cyclase [Demequina sp. NBRC 110052]